MKEYMGKYKKLYAAFMDLEKAYARADRQSLWSVLKICGVGGQQLKGIQDIETSIRHTGFSL